tara:strand:+ start:39 stop:1694 length:1656 start_codon:yes stop_codon:yes gene_type:complete
MALSININSITNIDTNHTVSISAGSGVSATTTNSTFFSTTKYVLSPNSGVQATVATITFTASADYYYFKEPNYKIKTPYNSSYDISETVTKDSNNRITSKVFVIKYFNTVNSSGDLIIFDHQTKALPATKNIHNNNILEIKSFLLETRDLISTGEVRSFVVKGDPTAKFNLKITKDNPAGSDTTYDFVERSFTSSATELTNQEIDSTGEFSDYINFPSITQDDTYTVELSPVLSKGTTLNTLIQDSTNKNLKTLTINQYKIITISVNLASSSYSGSYSSFPPATINITGERNSTEIVTTKFSYDLSLSANSFTFARGYGAYFAGMSPIDIRSSVVKTKNGNQTASAIVAFDDVNGLIPGMAMTGTGVTGSPRVLSINATDKTVTVSVTQNASGDGGIADNASITFTYGGSETSKAISGCEFELLGIDEQTTGYFLNAVKLTPVTTLVNDSTVNGSDGVVTVDSVAGIKAASTTTVSGRGINAAVTTPHVTNVNTGTNTVTLSANQTLDDNTPLTFTGSSRNATLAFDLNITNFGEKDHTLTINLDTILTVS